MVKPVPRRGNGVSLTFALPTLGMAVLVGLLGIAFPSSAAAGLTTTSPEVKEAVERGVKYLESDGAKDGRVGAQALIGLALYKATGRTDHPKLLDAVAKIKTAMGGYDADKLDPTAFDIYCTGLAIIFLVEVDPATYRSEIQCLLSSLHLRQKPHGGWGYPNRETGDTSMTQYGVLSSWEAKQAGFDVPMESIEKVMEWLLRTQDPSGGFGYQGAIGKEGVLVPQSEIRPGMSAAGLGSVYICSSMLGLIERAERRKSNLPPSLREIKSKEKRDPSKFRSKIDAKLVREAEARGVRWFDANYKVDPPGFTHYYLYAYERCMSFREFCENRVEKEPTWYDDGAQYLIKSQGKDGSWASQSGAVPDTAFSVLFLLRSMKKSLEKAYAYGEGTMIGGRGIPKDIDKVELRGGQLVERSLLGPADKLLSALEDSDKADFEGNIDLLAELPADKVEMLSDKQRSMIRKLVSNKAPAARLAAVKALGKSRNLENVDILIYALSDPDGIVVHAANEALLRISRSPRLVTIPEEPTDADRKAAIKKWKAWYRAIRPNAEASG